MWLMLPSAATLQKRFYRGVNGTGFGLGLRNAGCLRGFTLARPRLVRPQTLLRQELQMPRIPRQSIVAAGERAATDALPALRKLFGKR